MSDRCTEEKFLKDVASHKMHTFLNDGIYRHVRFAQQGHYNMSFQFVTWPGYFAYSGDMGCYVFSRVPDMFEFFREPAIRENMEPLRINIDYWSEKVVAADRLGVKAYNPETFRHFINDRLTQHIAEANYSPEMDFDVRQAVKNDVLSQADNGEFDAMQAAMAFNFEGLLFSEIPLDGFREFTYHFTWCCYALAWGIRKFDDFQLTGFKAS